MKIYKNRLYWSPGVPWMGPWGRLGLGEPWAVGPLGRWDLGALGPWGLGASGPFSETSEIDFGMIWERFGNDLGLI